MISNFELFGDKDYFQLLRYLFGYCSNYIEFRTINHETDEVRQMFYELTGKRVPLENLEDFHKQGFDIYYAPGIRKFKKGTRDSVIEVPVLWVDIDNKHNEDLEDRIDNIHAISKEIDLIPSVIINSGNGFHLYFKFKQNIQIRSQEDIQEIESRLRWLASIFGGDSVWDISRVMRLPGFYNLKDPQNPKKCSIIAFNKDAKYELSDFKTTNIKENNMEKITLGKLPDEKPLRFYDLQKEDSNLNKTWLGLREDLSDTSGSGYDMALADVLVRRNFSNEEIARILIDAPYEKTNHRTLAYLEHTISKARAGNEEIFQVFTENKGLAGLSLKPEDFDDSNIEYLIDDFLPKNTLMLMTGRYGVGKSYFNLAVAKKLIDDGHKVVIVDVDMPKHIIHQRLKEAGLFELLGNKLHYVHSTNFPFRIDSKNPNWCEFKNRIEVENNTIVIFDNMKELFPYGEDLNIDSNVIPVMNELKEVRDMCNTIILIHHVSKDSSSIHPFKNSGSIADSVDIAYLLERRGNDCVLKCFKSRIPIKETVKFFIESDFTMQTKETEQEAADLDKMITIYEVIRKRCEGVDGLLQKDIIEEMFGFLSRDKVRELLFKGEDMLWKRTQGDKNSYYYVPIEIDAQNSKSLPPYILKKLGILELEEDKSVEEVDEKFLQGNEVLENITLQ